MALKTNLVAYYKLEDETDSHGAFDLTVDGATAGATGKIDDAYDFDGGNDKMYCDDLFEMDSQTAVSISAWLKTDNIGAASNRYIGVLFGSKSTGGVAIRVATDANKVFQAIMRTAGEGELRYAQGATNFVYGTYYHVVGVFQDGTVTIYINNADKVSNTGASGTPTFVEINNDDADNLRLGFDAVDGKYYDGKIDEVAVWNRALTDAEVEELYNEGNGLSYDEWDAAAGTNSQINIGDNWKTIDSIQINIGDNWKEVSGMQVNIGDNWKTIF